LEKTLDRVREIPANISGISGAFPDLERMQGDNHPFRSAVLLLRERPVEAGLRPSILEVSEDLTSSLVQAEVWEDVAGKADGRKRPRFAPRRAHWNHLAGSRYARSANSFWETHACASIPALSSFP